MVKSILINFPHLRVCKPRFKVSKIHCMTTDTIEIGSRIYTAELKKCRTCNTTFKGIPRRVYCCERCRTAGSYSRNYVKILATARAKTAARRAEKTTA